MPNQETDDPRAGAIGQAGTKADHNCLSPVGADRQYNYAAGPFLKLSPSEFERRERTRAHVLRQCELLLGQQVGAAGR
jgi:hypothetical protein